MKLTRLFILIGIERRAAGLTRLLHLAYPASETKDLADSPRVGRKVKTFPDGKQEIVEGDMVDRSRLMVDTRKWLLSKMFPKKYGDKVNLETEVSGPGGAPIPMQHTIVFVKPDGTSGVLPERNESK